MCWSVHFYISRISCTAMNMFNRECFFPFPTPLPQEILILVYLRTFVDFKCLIERNSFWTLQGTQSFLKPSGFKECSMSVKLNSCLSDQAN